MASKIRDKVSQAVPSVQSSEERRETKAAATKEAPVSETSQLSNEDAELAGHKYLLRITAGSSYDESTHRVVAVNGEALSIENEFVSAKLKVRIRDYTGLPKTSSKSSIYFSDPVHEKDQYSIGFSFIPKKDIPAENLVWGNDFDHPVRDRLPPAPLFNTAFKIVKNFIDPGLNCDAYCDKPWLYGPALSCWFAFSIGDEQPNASLENVPEPSDENVLKEGATGSGKQIRESYKLPGTSDGRRKHFLDENNRRAFRLEKGRLYDADFYNPYLDFNNFSLKLPGFSLSVFKYINDKTHSLRHVFKDEKTNEVYLVVIFTLLHGEDIDRALTAEG